MGATGPSWLAVLLLLLQSHWLVRPCSGRVEWRRAGEHQGHSPDWAGLAQDLPSGASGTPAANGGTQGANAGVS